MHDGDSSRTIPRGPSNYIRRPGHYIKLAYQRIREGSSTQLGLAQFVPQFEAISEGDSGALVRSYFQGREHPAINQPLDQRSLSFVFRCPGRNLSEIRTILNTFGTARSLKVRLGLFRVGEQSPARSLDIRHEVSSDGAVTVFRFDPVADSAGTWFEVRLAVIDSSPGQRIWINGRVVPKHSQTFREFERSSNGQSVSVIEGTDERVERLFTQEADEKLFVPRYFGFGKNSSSPLIPLQFGWQGLRLKSIPKPLNPDSPLVLPFTCPVDRLEELQLFLATFDRNNSGTIELRLSDISVAGQRIDLRSEVIAAESIINNSPYRFRFSPLTSFRGLKLELQILAAGCSKDTAPGIWGNFVDSKSELARRIGVEANLVDLLPQTTFGPDRSDVERPGKGEVPDNIRRAILMLSLEEWNSPGSALVSAINVAQAQGLELVPVFPQNTEFAVQELLQFDALILYNLAMSAPVKELIRLSKLTGRMVLGIKGEASENKLHGNLKLERSDSGRVLEQSANRAELLANCDYVIGDPKAIDFSAEHAAYLEQRFPSISIVTTMPDASVAEQRYPGLVEVIKFQSDWRETLEQIKGSVIIIASDGTNDPELACRHNEKLLFGRFDLAIEGQPTELDTSPAVSALTCRGPISFRKSTVKNLDLDELLTRYAPGGTEPLDLQYARGAIAFRIYNSGGRLGTIELRGKSNPGPGTNPGQNSSASPADQIPDNFVSATALAAQPDLFRKLLADNQELPVVLRRWFESVAAHSGLDTSKIDGLSSSHKVRTGKRGLRILSYRWHVGHQYELYKLPHSFTLATGLGTKFTSQWNYRERPLPNNARLIPWHKINPLDYDLAILHFDENVLAPENCNLKLSIDWGESFRHLREHCSLPMVAICHGTPQFYGQYDIKYSAENLGQTIETERLRLVEYLANILVITNSEQARIEWGFHRSKTIWHGLDPSQFPDASRQKGILTLGKPMAERPHYRGYFLAESVLKQLPESLSPHSLEVIEPSAALLPDSNDYADARFRNYVDAIRSYSIYFNPTLRSPMPRSRAEAMMCGLAVVTADNHDTSKFIENGVNGFRSNDPTELRDFLSELATKAELARKIGLAGRKTACDLFNQDRYLESWQSTLETLV